ncbi:uncharacterized protein LOC142321830 [Lycorma delicatula]|uniref:uncharacterized protein LOC142321830 n=1 Tax=Lycorma delicatula TaxID=130591 RepID=UPI003F518595
MHICSTLSIVLFITTLFFGSEAKWNGFIGKFTQKLFFADGFYDLPRTVNEAKESSPPFIDTKLKDPDFDLKIHCLDSDPHVCVLFDKNDNVGGIRISHLKNEITDDFLTFPYKYDNISVFNHAIFLGKELWYADFLFTNPDNLKNNGVGKITKDETADGLWVRLSTGWTEIPRKECDAQAKGWQKQGFLAWMGNHYSYGQTDDCSIFIPLLPLYHKGELVGLAFVPLGKYTAVSRKWFEDVPSYIIKTIIPHGYKPCLQDWTEKYKVSSFHIYFTNHPRYILWDQSPTC